MEDFRLREVWYFIYIGTIAFGRKYELPTWPSRCPRSITLHSGHSPSAPPLNAKDQAPNHSGRCWARPLDLQPSGPPVPRFKALSSAQTSHRHQLGSTASTAPSCSLPWEVDGSAALESFSLLFWITLWKTETSPRTFRDITYQESSFFPFSPKWAWMGLKKPLLNP